MGGSSASALMAVFGSRFHILLDALCRLKSQVRDLHESVMAVFFDTHAHHVERRLLCLSPQITHSTSCDPNQKMNLISEVYMHASLWTISLSKNTHKYNMPLILESGLWIGFFFIGMCAHIWQIPKPEQCASGQHWRHGVQQHPQIAGWVNPEAGLRDTTRKVCYWDTLEWSCMWRHDMSKNIYQKVKSGAAPIKSLPKKWMSPFRHSLWWINKAVKSTKWVWCINNFLHPFWHSYAINWPSHHMFTLEKLALRQSNKTEICFFSPTNRGQNWLIWEIQVKPDINLTCNCPHILCLKLKLSHQLTVRLPYARQLVVGCWSSLTWNLKLQSSPKSTINKDSLNHRPDTTA